MTDEVKTQEGQEAAQNVEAEARKQGWKPIEEFNGDPDKWVDAKEFVERGRTWAPITAAKNRELEKTLKEMKQVLREQMAMNQRRQIQVRQQSEHQIKVLQGQIAGLEKQLAEALASHDAEAAVQVTRAIRQKDAEVTEAQANMQNVDVENQRIADAWKSVNPWYGDDLEATEYADFIGERAARQGKSPQEILATIDEKMQQKFPDLYGEGAEEVEEGMKPRKPNGPVRQTRRAAPKQKDANEDGGSPALIKWSDLSSEDQRIAETVIKKSGLSKAEYLKQLSGQM